MRMYAHSFMTIIALLGVLTVGTASADVQNIVVIGWDGTQRAHLQEMIARDEVPNLMSLVQDGKLVEIDVTNGATDTKAGWTQILTGYKAETTGVQSNAWYQPIPVGYSVFERLEAFFGPEHIDTVAIIGKKGHVDDDPPQKIPLERWQKQEQKQKKINQQKPGLGNLQGGQIIEENGKKFVAIPGKPWYNASSRMDLFVNGLSKNEVVGQKALEELEKRKDQRFFFFIHFAEPDHAGHAHGENSQEYTDAIKSDDEWTGKIIAKLKALNLYDKTLVYVVVDHGFNEGAMGHNYAPYVFLGTNDPNLIRDGDRMDIAPTILKRFGVDLGALQPTLDGVPLDVPAERKVAPAEAPEKPKKKAGKKPS